MIIDHTHTHYKRKLAALGSGRYNGAYYYSKEIVENIIPRVKTDRSWITVNIPGFGCDHSIVFIHNNLHPEHYDWLNMFNDLVLICGVPETIEKVKHIGSAFYLPLSVDVEDISKYKTEKTKDIAFAGRPAKMCNLGKDIPAIGNLPRDKFLKEMAKHKRIYAVGRTAIEAKVLGCEVLPYDPRFPDPNVWEIVDNKDAARMLQTIINVKDRL